MTNSRRPSYGRPIIWSARRDPDRPTHAHLSGSGWSNFARFVVRMNGAMSDNEDGLANLGLALAAPAMLAALELAKEDMEQPPSECARAYDAVKAAIALAKTTPELEPSSAVGVSPDDVADELAQALRRVLGRVDPVAVGNLAYGKALLALARHEGDT